MSCSSCGANKKTSVKEIEQKLTTKNDVVKMVLNVKLSNEPKPKPTKNS
jgi:transcription elongation factor Elf1